MEGRNILRPSTLFFLISSPMKTFFFFCSLFLFLPLVFAGETSGTVSTGAQTGPTGVVISVPIASPGAGTYSSTQNVSLTASGSQYICYSTNGTAPSCNWNTLSCTTGNKYTAPISISSTTTLQGISCYQNGESSSPASYTYTISSGGGGGGGGGSSRRCNKPVFTNMSPAKNAVVSSLSTITFTFEDAEADSGSIALDGTELASNIVDNGDGTYTVTATLDTPITEDGTHTLSFSAEKSRNCSRTLVYGITVGEGGTGTGTGSSNGGGSGNNPSGFQDIIGHWAQGYINTLYSWGAINGKTDTVFDPDANLTRAEAIKIALLAKKESIPESVTEPPFPDVAVNSWYAPFVQKGKEMGIIHGFPNGTYGPNRPVTRAEALKILLLAANVSTEGYSPKTPFVDVEEYAWYAPLIAWAYDHEIVSGVKPKIFLPHKYITRAEFSKIAVLLFSL